VRNRGIGRGRLFLGALLLLAAIMTCAVGLMMSPHGDVVAKGTEHVKTVVVTYMSRSAIGTLVLSALAAWLLFPARRPKWPARDWVLIVVLVLLAGSSIYTLAWLQISVLH
jgi:drug/metabolite transporter (DMT)-like permease